MSKPGDLVEFKDGLHGIAAPSNLGILLDRWRVKGVPWVRLMTVAGPKEAKAEHVGRRVFKERHAGPLGDEAAVQARLRHLVAQHAKGGLAEEPEGDLDRLEQALWEATAGAGREAWAEAEIAAAHFGPGPSAVQVRDARAALDRCRRAGRGRFQTVAGRGDTWRPWTRAEAGRMRAAWADLQQLRRRLVRTAEAAGDAAQASEGERRFERVPLAEAGLTQRDHDTLAWVKAAMAQYVEWDGVPDGAEPVAGIGGLGATQAFGMDLHRQLGFLAQDWIGSEHTSTSSDYVHFLLESGLWTPQGAVDALVRRHVNQEEFFEHAEDPRMEAEAARFPEPDLLQDPGRVDLRAIPCWTIDPPDARDFDDAVGIEPLDASAGTAEVAGAAGAAGATTRLWVHVADVSHYVRLDTALDRHARRRATSVYLPGQVLPMLPRRLSDHLCSLRSDGDRFALSVALDVDPQGRVRAARSCKSVIRVTENLHYGEALRRARDGVPAFAALLGLAQRMRSQRQGLELETGELKVLLGATGFSALEKRADDATRMIETFMVAANEAVARELAEAQVPLLFRCHPLPDPDKAERFRHQAQAMGFPPLGPLPRKPTKAAEAQAESLLDRLKSGGGKLELFGGGVAFGGAGPPQAAPAAAPPPPAALPGFSSLAPEERERWLAPFRPVVAALAQAQDDGLAEVATYKLLACMGRAHYSPDNEGHFGLASTHYCHFTSPIRRYPDLVVHRNLKWKLDGAVGAPPHEQAALRAMCDHCSDQERAADALERRIKASCLVLASVGDAGPSGGAAPTGRARITGLTPASLFVLRDDGIEARIPARDLPGGPYQVDEWESELQFLGRERDGPPGAAAAMDEPRVRARLGGRVSVALAGRDVAAGRTGARLVSWN